ncbi:hypothetical protein Kpol_1055p83 [Vanderwaltozyma polyspora DSM 70294]|uniref:A-factor-processing enzyme n=1 Tax=Vanderwaltozyma polyspora (strain ATCC 22028 / DSM 70294 / BCRC 21397 / CBS 2163 / NBRC 10782 / NRRL Y-8283 / UCD 57-17) TaxID=436907 RepID=A7TGF6_VANPO|nr:uncharacterized protein Kpol_1055p83 [Vanderwaltozyma polyspora DSM 70294]EDO18726.1 hypothetical protein Kpol_1055p83 [Vanderwaltozyma polyspora DSM 70294]
MSFALINQSLLSNIGISVKSNVPTILSRSIPLYLRNFTKINYYKRKMSTTSDVTKKPYKIHDLNFIKPDLDDRSYRFIELPNKFKALLIHDASTDKSAASLDVNIGAFQDPKNLQGLAHFCEHLLFMGSKKFPNENEYSSYLNKHGGSSNAYTGAQNTNYFFEINHEHLHGALDRFSGFFTCPLFNPNSTSKEINAVDSENKKNLQNDVWRMYQLDKSLSNEKHPYHKFSTGNLKTLDEMPKKEGLDIRNELLKFYSDSYSANLMKLCVLGREDLDTMSDWVYNLFEAVPNNNRPLPEYNEPILLEENLKKIIHVKPVKDLKKLEITFLAQDMDLFWESKPQHILSHLIGHEGSGSILSHLKTLSWANELSAGGHTVSKDNAFFSIDIDLTENGFQHYKEIVHIVFQYIEMLKISLPQERIFLELQDIANASFKFKQKVNPSSTVSNLSKALEKEYIPVENILSTGLFRKYDPEIMKNYVNSLSPDNSRITLAGKAVETDSKETWYGTDYRVEDYPKDLYDTIKSPGLNPNLSIPRPNEFIATNFDVEKFDVNEPLVEPLLLKDSPVSKLWYKKDDRFWQPRGFIYITMKLPHTQASVINNLLTSLYVQLVNDSLKDLQYDAACANLHLSFSKTNQGLDITISGFNDKLIVLLQRFIYGVSVYQPSKLRFKIFKEKTIQNLKNCLYEVPYSQISTLYSSLINERTWSVKQKLSIIEKITYEQFLAFLPTIYEECYFDGLVHGNFRNEEAVEIDSLVQSLITTDIVNLHVKNTRLRSYVIPNGETYRFEIDLEDAENVNSCVQHVVQLGGYSEELSAMSGLFAQILNEPCFDTLRTKEQLGYVVFSSSLNNHGTANIRILVQSEHSTPYLEWRIDEFYKSFGETLRNMSDDELEKHKDALCKSLMQKYKNMKEENSRYTAAIYLGDYNFTHRQKKANLVAQISKDQLIKFFEDHFISANAAKLVIHLKSKVKSSDKDINEDKLDVKKYPTGKLITDVDEFKSKLYAAPIRQPLKKFDVYKP